MRPWKIALFGSLIVVALGIEAESREVNKAFLAPVKTVLFETEAREGGSRLVRILSDLVYSNECFVPARKIISIVEDRGSYLSYRVYNDPAEALICPKIYMPVQTQMVVDEVELGPDQGLTVMVNGAVGVLTLDPDT